MPVLDVKTVKVEKLPVATITALGHNTISLKIEMDGTEQVFDFKTSEKVNDFAINRPEQFHVGAVIEYSAKGGLVSLIRPAKGFVKAHDLPKEVAPIIDAEKEQKKVPEKQAPPKVVPMEAIVKTTVIPSDTAVNVKTIGMYDPAKITKVSMSFHVNIQNYEYVEWSVEGTDEDAVKRAAIAIGSGLGKNHEPTREAVQTYLKRILIA